MRTKPPASLIPSEKLALYDQLVETIPGLERKGATMPYTSVNGHMFSFLAKDGTLALRLSAKDREDFLAQYGSTLQEAHGTVLKEYVSVPDKLLKNIPELKKYLSLSFEYAKSLKPKPQKKRQAVQKKTKT